VTTLLGQTFAARFEANYSVVVHSDRQPTQADWNRLLQVYRNNPGPRTAPILVYTDGGAPDALQRAELVKVFGPKRPRVAILTKSIIARAAAKAISLIVTELRVFNVDRVDSALEHLGLYEADKLTAARILSTLRQELKAAVSASQRPRPDD
jgi:hypothetical protein